MLKTLRNTEAEFIKQSTELGHSKEALRAAEEKNVSIKSQYDQMETIYKSKLDSLQEQLDKFQCKYLTTKFPKGAFIVPVISLSDIT